MDRLKIVEFDIYCNTCKHYKTSDIEDPCYSCLGYPARVNSKKPKNYEEDQKRKKNNSLNE